MNTLLISTACVLSFVAGFAVAWAASRREVGKRRELSFLIRCPVDLEPSEFGTFWEARS